MEKKVRLIFLSIILTWIISCKKEDTSTLDIKQALDLSRYKLSQKIINDSIIEYTGENEKLSIKGEYNKNRNHKIGWWNVYDKKKKEIFSKIQIFVEDDKEKINQVLIYDNNKIDTSKSKFYTKDIEYQNNRLSKIKYNFFTPKSTFKTKNIDLFYDIFTDENNSVTKKASIEVKNQSHHYYEIDLSKYYDKKNIFIAGLFSEYSYGNKTDEMGINEMFIEDSIKAKSSH
ncbi:hypothetical protein NAL32_00705 [Chryseobacterium sp. Ch-15]|uniref:Lipoprotein n=1 Tax=Chryseobacterium muglaense TaxID=2893752 RepID=A0A9Q3UX92_9FLAO|nr:hypothetical protein [Chryseobacterium muglaense]MBD3903568.1 hypothetical protein [Chryseobacterium muglaense]MCC9034640.1 hypothetical protein [Chryseobacterium muglaense]MCM2552903.1 hypothetical protein [Chryseobacterium muglaense]